MKIINLSRKDFRLLEEFKLSSGITAGEAVFYYKPNDKNRILKAYVNNDPLYLDTKLDTILELDLNKEKINIPELVLADEIFTVDDKFKGSITLAVPGKNASVYLRSKEIPINTKIQILKQIGSILDRISKCDPSLNLAFADVHMDNFLVDETDSNIKTYGIDTDSMKIKDNSGITNFYLGYSPAKKVKKYETLGNMIVLPSKETDIFCFIMMIMELISGDRNIFKMPIKRFKKYLDYLDSIGFDSSLLASFASVYENDKDNINPLPYLDALSKISDKSSLSSFVRHR